MSLSPTAAQRNRSVFNFAMGACVVYYVFINISCQGDFQGDSWEYLSKAAQVRTEGSTPYTYLRGLVYPWLLAVTWGRDGFFTYLIQSGLFLGALYAALRVLAFGSIYCTLPILAAMIPAVTFLQNQIYPDGLLISLTLLFFVAVARKYWAISLVIAVILAFTKLVFILVLPGALLAHLLHCNALRRRVVLYVALSASLMAVPGLLLFNYVFVDLSYMILFVRPYNKGYPLDRIFPGPALKIKCGGSEHSIPREALYWDPIKIPHALSPHGPLTPAQSTQLGCTESDILAMKRHLMAECFLSNPFLHIRLGAQALLRSLAGSYDFPHISGILLARKQLWLTHFNERSYFEEREIGLIRQHKKRGFEIVQAQPLLFTLSAFGFPWGEAVIRWIALGTLAFCMALAFRRGLLPHLLEDPVTLSIVPFLVVYPLCIVISVPVVYDRYTLINLLLLCILAARFAAMVLDGANPASTLPAAEMPIAAQLEAAKPKSKKPSKRSR